MAKAPIRQIDNSFVRAKSHEDTMKAENGRQHRVHKRRLIVLAVILLMIGVFGVLRLHNISAERQVADANLVTAKKQLHKVKRQKKALKVQVDQLNNADYLAKLVRAKYYVSKSGEIIFTLPEKVNKIDTK